MGAAYVFESPTAISVPVVQSANGFVLWDECPNTVQGVKVPDDFKTLVKNSEYVCAYRGYLFPTNHSSVQTQMDLSKCLFNRIIRGHAMAFDQIAADAAHADYESGYAAYLDKLYESMKNK